MLGEEQTKTSRSLTDYAETDESENEEQGENLSEDRMASHRGHNSSDGNEHVRFD